MHDTHLGNVSHRPQFSSLIMAYLLKSKKENGGLGFTSPQEQKGKFLLATPFRLLENAFSASSSNC